MTAIPPMVTLHEYQKLGEQLRKMEGLVLRNAAEVEELRDRLAIAHRVHEVHLTTTAVLQEKCTDLTDELFAANREIERLKERAR